MKKEVDNNRLIDFEVIQGYFNNINLYTKEDSSFKENFGTRAWNQFTTIRREVNFQNDFKNYKDIKSWTTQKGNKEVGPRTYFWIHLKKEIYANYQSSISIFMDIEGIRVVIESDYKDSEKQYIEDFTKHNKYLKFLKQFKYFRYNKEHLEKMKYWIKKGFYNEYCYKSISYLKDNEIQKVNKRYDNIHTLQAGYILTYDDLKKYSKYEGEDTLKTVSLNEVIEWINKCIEKLKPYYEICIGEGEDSIMSEENNINDDFFENEFEINKDKLFFEEKTKKMIEKQISKALKNGKHIILTGPPGTGKSKLAKEICKHYQKYYKGIDNKELTYKMTTAIADWSTYDTIGGYNSNKDGLLYFQPGIFLSCFKEKKDKDKYENKNEWLIIDEMNRADIDKAFGTFFSVLSGDSVSLSFKTDDDKNIKIILEEDKKNEGDIENNEYMIPKNWRLIGTINSYDKTSLFEMSYAFMRRFAFIPVPVVKNINEDLIKNYFEGWNIQNKNEYEKDFEKDLAKLWKNINQRREVGPAIVKDIAQYVDSKEDWGSAIILYVLPQFEGLDEKELIKFCDEIKKCSFIYEESLSYIKNFIKDFFGISIGGD